MFDGFRDENSKLGIYMNDLEGYDSEAANNLRAELLTSQTQGNQYLNLYFNEFL